MINKKVYSLMEAYYQVYENEILDEVTGKGAIDPGSNFPNHRERNTRTHQQAGMAMSPLERAMRREKALRSRGNTKATQRANQIKSRFIRPTERGIVRAIDSGNRADFNARQRMSESIDTYDVILDYLISEGLVETEYNAVQIMAHMSDEWADSIIESYYSLPLGKVMRKVSDLSRTSEKFRSDSSVRNQAKKSGASDADIKKSSEKYQNRADKIITLIGRHNPNKAQSREKINKNTITVQPVYKQLK